MRDPPRPTVRALVSPEEYEACVALQRATWGDDFRELVPPAVLQIARRLGGIVAGAFLGERLVGFVFGLTGVRDGTVVHWSHMLAVEHAYRDRGIGQRLKAHQRAELVAAGITRMHWTFDPLVARNAHLNIHLLGARVIEYVRDMYGDNPRSRTDSVIGSDRFVVVWDLAADTPVRRGPRRAGGPTIVGATSPLPDAPTVRIAVPPDIQQVKGADPAAALGWRASTRRAFEHYLGRGFTITDFARGTGDDPSAYVVERPT